MRLLLWLFLASALVAQAPSGAHSLDLDLRTSLGTEPARQFRLAPPGCWDGLLSFASARPTRPGKTDPTGATVEVWDMALRESPREADFRLFIGDFRQRLSKALAAPPASHGQADLAIFMGTLATQGNTTGLDSTMVRSLQDRFNALPPNGSPVK